MTRRPRTLVEAAADLHEGLVDLWEAVVDAFEAAVVLPLARLLARLEK